MDIFEECGGFFREFRRHFRTTGAILPSGPFLAASLTSRLRGQRLGARILEVGPGTGAVTRVIARRMLPGDQLEAVEINGFFVRLLERRLEEDPAFAHCRDRVEVIHASLEDLPGESVYDYIVSGLPLNNFPVDQVREIFAAFNRLLKPGGTLSYFEYVLLRHLKTPFVDRRERRRLLRVGRVVGRYNRAYQVGRERIFVNVPPAIVRHLRLKPALALPGAARR
jgi:phospholipid N-methyltransferase